MDVVKASGKREKFNERKVYRTCLRAGANKDLANQIVASVKKKLYNGIKTQEILQLILKLLKVTNPIVATRYNLKKAVLRLGPAGFIFEKFMVRLLQSYNYQARLPEILTGACVNHEIDIIAQPSSSPEPLKWIESRQKNIYMIECKYHNAPGIRCGLKVVLYTWARFLDLQEGWRQKQVEKLDYPWLISNTKFSQSAIQYARCRGMRLLGWRYPQEAGLEYLIEKKKVYPVTILKSLDHATKKRLFSENIILCSDLLSMEKDILYKKTKIKDKKLTSLINEAKLVV